MVNFYGKADSVELTFFFCRLLTTNVIFLDFVASFYWAYVFFNLDRVNLILRLDRRDYRENFKIYERMILLDRLTMYS